MRITNKKMADAIRECRGLLGIVAQKLDCTTAEIEARIEKHKVVRDAYNEARKLIEDYAELKLYEAVQNGEAWAVKHFLAGRDSEPSIELPTADQSPIDLRVGLRIRSPRLAELSPAQRVFLAAYIESRANASQAARSLPGNPNSTLAKHYRWQTKSRNADAYVECLREATKIGVDGLVDEATRRAVDGVRDVVLHKGEPVIIDGKPLYRIRYSDGLLQFLITKRDPERYGDRAKIEMDGRLNVNATIRIETEDDLREHEKRLGLYDPANDDDAELVPSDQWPTLPPSARHNGNGHSANGQNGSSSA